MSQERLALPVWQLSNRRLWHAVPAGDRSCPQGIPSGSRAAGRAPLKRGPEASTAGHGAGRDGPPHLNSLPSIGTMKSQTIGVPDTVQSSCPEP